MAFLIESERLIIRPWREADRDAFAVFARDPVMMQFISGGEPWDEIRIDEFFGRQARHLENTGTCFGAAVERLTDELVGVSGVQPLGEGTGELGWWIARARWGQGLATEGALASVDYAFGPLHLQRLIAVADPANHASIRIMRKIGMRSLGVRRGGDYNPNYGDTPSAIHELSRPESAGG